MVDHRCRRGRCVRARRAVPGLSELSGQARHDCRRQRVQACGRRARRGFRCPRLHIDIGYRRTGQPDRFPRPQCAAVLPGGSVVSAVLGPDQDLEQNQAALRAAGVDAVVSITTDPANLIGQKAADEKLTTPVLSDPSMQVSRAYDANSYGMMGDMRDGHSFILVGPDGTIRWRADYGGKPDYTMFLPTPKMLTDLTAEQKS